MQPPLPVRPLARARERGPGLSARRERVGSAAHPRRERVPLPVDGRAACYTARASASRCSAGARPTALSKACSTAEVVSVASAAALKG